MSNPKKDILAKLLPEDSQTLEEKTNLTNKIISFGATTGTRTVKRKQLDQIPPMP